MGGFVDIIIYVSIAIIYNFFVHNLASISYKDLQYEEKHQNTIVMLVLFGGIGILISKIMDDKNKKYKNSVVSKGLYYGGILLILTSLFANWDSIAQELKLFGVAGVLGCLVWYGYNRETTENKKKEEDRKINEEILSELVNDDNKIITNNVNNIASQQVADPNIIKK